VQARAEQLLAAYGLQSFYHNSTARNYRENLFYLDMLETALQASGVQLPHTFSAADIGPGDWFYVNALHALLKWWHVPSAREVRLDGYEGDAYRVYASFHSRYDHALAYISDQAGVRYLPQLFSHQPGEYTVITMLFPFVFLQDHLAWGLPRSLFQPQRLLVSAWQSLKPGGVLLIANQGAQEHQQQLAFCRAAGIEPQAAFQHDSDLFQYDLPRFVIAARQDG